MVDVSGKEPTQRTARAGGRVMMKKKTLALIKSGRMPKGDLPAIAKVAGIMAAKKTPELIPLCHPIPLDRISVEISINEKELAVEIEASAKTLASTGVEMEALTAVSIAALTIYDMCKAVDKEAVISDIKLLEKTGGKSGTFKIKNKNKRD